MKKTIVILISGLLFWTGVHAQKIKYEPIGHVFSMHDDVDYRFYNGFEVDLYSYYLNHDTLFYKYGTMGEFGYPLAIMDMATPVISKSPNIMTESRVNIYELRINAVAGQYFISPLLGGFKKSVYNNKDISFLFPTEEIAAEALNFLKTEKEKKKYEVPAASGNVSSGASALAMLFGAGGSDEDSTEVLDEIFETKDDVDYEFGSAKGAFDDFKYFLDETTLWAYGNELYAFSVPLNDIDFDKTTIRESRLWIKRDGSKCVELTMYPKKSKFFVPDFSDPASMPFEEKFGGQKLSSAKLILPDKALADALIKYLKNKLE